jgi:hypothetical protein
MLVLIHHSVIAYTYCGHTDKQSFLGFDGVVLFNDSFFMAAMFFLSGLFVWPSLKRKGIGSCATTSGGSAFPSSCAR